jgi:hypothetical protein
VDREWIAVPGTQLPRDEWPYSLAPKFSGQNFAARSSNQSICVWIAGQSLSCRSFDCEWKDWHQILNTTTRVLPDWDGDLAKPEQPVHSRPHDHPLPRPPQLWGYAARGHDSV